MPLRFFRPTVDSIVSNIARQVQQLQDAADGHHSKAQDHNDLAAVHTTQAQHHNSEFARARGIAAKLASLINP